MQYRGISNIRIIRTGVYLDTVRSSGSMRGAVVGVSSLVYGEDAPLRPSDSLISVSRMLPWHLKEPKLAISRHVSRLVPRVLK